MLSNNVGFTVNVRHPLHNDLTNNVGFTVSVRHPLHNALVGNVGFTVSVSVRRPLSSTLPESMCAFLSESGDLYIML